MDRLNVNTIMKLNSTVKMLEAALQILGQEMIEAILLKVVELPADEQEAYFTSLTNNIYTHIKIAVTETEINYEEHKKKPETMMKVQQMMDLINELTNDEDLLTETKDDKKDGNDNLQ